MPNMTGDEFAIGLSELLGVAWWQGDGETVGTHHDGAVPLQRVDELIGFKPVFTRLPHMFAGDAQAPLMISHPNNGYLIGLNGPKYPENDYRERLLDNVVKLLDTSAGDLITSSCGILSGGRQAFIQIALGDPTVHMATGERFSQWLVAYSSMDGSLKTAFQKGCTRVVCRNTFQAFRGEHGKKYAYRNTQNNAMSVLTARSVLDVFAEMGDDLFAQLEKETETPVSDQQWEAIIEMLYPTENRTGPGVARNKNIQTDLSEMYYQDDRVGFVGTQWGAFQALSTWAQHERKVRGSAAEGKDDSKVTQTRLGKNMFSVLDESWSDEEKVFQGAIDRVLATVG